VDEDGSGTVDLEEFASMVKMYLEKSRPPDPKTLGDPIKVLFTNFCQLHSILTFINFPTTDTRRRNEGAL